MLDLDQSGVREELVDVLNSCIGHFDAGEPVGDLERRCKAMVMLLEFA